MKHKKLTITVDDYILANRKASREEEIAAHGKQISFRKAIHKSKKTYTRKTNLHILLKNFQRLME